MAPLSEDAGLDSVEEAYAIQTAWERIRVGRGDEVVGRKIGLTSRAMQEQLGVDEPDYGSLWASRRFSARDVHARVETDLFIAPRIEGEIAFKLARPLEGPRVTDGDVLAATEAVALAAEIIDSRIVDWKIGLVDTIADNASFGGFVTGDWDETLDRDLAALELSVERNGELATRARGEAVLGHPATAVAWLANKLSEYGARLEAGDVVLSGSLGPAVPVAAKDSFVFRADGLSTLRVSFS